MNQVLDRAAMRLLVFSMFLVMLAIGNPLDYYEEESQLDPSNAYMLPLSAQVWKRELLIPSKFLFVIFHIILKEPGYNIYNRQLRLMKARAGLTDKGTYSISRKNPTFYSIPFCALRWMFKIPLIIILFLLCRFDDETW